MIAIEQWIEENKNLIILHLAAFNLHLSRTAIETFNFISFFPSLSAQQLPHKTNALHFISLRQIRKLKRAQSTALSIRQIVLHCI